MYGSRFAYRTHTIHRENPDPIQPTDRQNNNTTAPLVNDGRTARAQRRRSTHVGPITRNANANAKCMVRRAPSHLRYDAVERHGCLLFSCYLCRE